MTMRSVRAPAVGAVAAVGLALCSAVAASAQAPAPQEAIDFFEEEARNMQVLTASRHAEPIDEAAADITVITEAEIRELGASTLAEALELLPGVQVTTHRKGSQKIWVRGVTSTYNDKTLLLIDGFPFKEVVYGQHPLDEELPLTDVKRVELMKGPGSVMYGANAMSGIINVITKDPLDAKEVEAKAGIGSWDRQSHSVLIARQGTETGALVSGTFFETIGGRHDKDSDGKATARRQPKRLHASSIKLTHGDFRVSGRFQDFRYQQVSSPDTKTTTFRDRTALMGLLWRHGYGDRLGLSARAYHNVFDWPQDKESYKAGTGVLSKIEKRTEKTQVTGGSLQAEFSAPGGHSILGGLDVEVQEGREIEEVTFQTDVANPAPAVTRFADPASPTETQWAVFLQDSWRFLPEWRAVAGLRYDRPARIKGQASPRGALIYAPSRSFLGKLLYGRAYRAPSFREYYIREPTSTDGDNGNPALRAETIETVELLLQWRPGRGWRAGVSRQFGAHHARATVGPHGGGLQPLRYALLQPELLPSGIRHRASPAQLPRGGAAPVPLRASAWTEDVPAGEIERPLRAA